jgi:mannose-6-phosphate isomerase-like protein (cupin superfamily)
VFEPGTRTEKPWGYEILLTVNDSYAMKEIFLLAGTRSSLQSHTRKMETIVVVDGALTLELEDEHGAMGIRTVVTGDHYDVYPGRRHRVTAQIDTKLIETSTPELDDVIRHEDDFGRA